MRRRAARWSTLTLLLTGVAFASGGLLAGLWLERSLVAPRGPAQAGADPPGADPRAFVACEDLECKAGWAAARWPTDPQAVVAAIATVEDPLERIALVEQVADRWPGQIGVLCPLLPEGQARARCATQEQRLHLADQAELAEQDAAVALVAPAGVDLSAKSPWRSHPPAPVPCPTELARTSCQWQAAYAALSAGLVEQTGRACLAIDDARWQQECFFQAATLTLYQGAVPRVRGATELCLGSGDYLRYCLSTLTDRAVMGTPSASWPDPGGWSRLSADLSQLQQALRPLDPALADRLVHGAWSVALAGAYANVREVGGHPLRAAAPGAAPFVRAAAAWRLVQIEGDQARNLAEWTGLLDQALAQDALDLDAPAVEPWEDGMHHQRPTQPRPWGRFPRVPYLWLGERTFAEDPAVDAVICLVEAFGQHGEAQLPALDEALRSPVAEIQWTARQMARELGHEVDAAGRRRGRVDADASRIRRQGAAPELRPKGAEGPSI